MEGIGEDVAAVEAIVLVGTVVTMIARMVAAVLVDEMIIGIITMRGAGGIEAEVLDAEEDAAEVLQAGGIEVLLLERAVLKEGLRLSSGTGRENRPHLVIETAKIQTMTRTAMVMHGMGVLTMILSTSRSFTDTYIDPTGIFGFVSQLFIGILKDLLLLNMSDCNCYFDKIAHLENIAYSHFHCAGGVQVHCHVL